MFAVLHKELTMNQRIRELAEQATGTEEYDGFRYFDKAKFAELIVRECIDTVLDCTVEYSTRPQIADELREHFGVEE
jgi:hypothetical protein